MSICEPFIVLDMMKDYLQTIIARVPCPRQNNKAAAQYAGIDEDEKSSPGISTWDYFIVMVMRALLP